ncbi:unnamed protein product, partial [marine sediment metagenome]
MNAPLTDDKSRRWLIFRQLAPYFAKSVTAEFLQKTSKFLPDIERIHPLFEGIYKPAWSDFALAIRSVIDNPYDDEIHDLPDGRWWIKYSPKTGGMEIAQNVALLNCMKNHEPVIVLRQEAKGSGRGPTRYRLLGLGLIQEYEADSELFVIHGVDLATLESVCAELPENETIATVLRTEVLTPFIPFVQEERAVYRTSTEKRDAAFRSVVLDQYGHTCAVTGMRFRSSRATEAQAAHIIPKKEHGSDDPRNGMSLSRSMHWTLDRGI